ncbi:MAG: hypothetical protein P4L27_01005 [Ignavibacteriaceae bacterium]|nr:hypothetical protein [Ignavibacteriaceae bacterium]
MKETGGVLLHIQNKYSFCALGCNDKFNIVHIYAHKVDTAAGIFKDIKRFSRVRD